MSGGVLFNSIPGSGLVAPITTFEINSGGAYESNARVIILGHKTAAGSLADNTFAVCGNANDALALVGPGQLYETFRVARMNAPAQEFWIGVVPETGTAEIRTITIGTMPAAGGQGVVEIAGRQVVLQVAAGEAANTTATNLAAAINAFADPLTGAYLPYTATAATNVVTLTCRHKGALFSEIEVVAPDTIPGNIFAPAGRLVFATTTPGSGTPSVSALLAALGDEPFDAIISPFSEAANVAAVETFLSETAGRWAWDRQIYGHHCTVTTGNLSALTTLGLTRNNAHESFIGRVASPTPSWEWAAGIYARVLPWLLDDTNGNIARNHTGLVVEGVRPPRDRTTWFGYAARNTLTKSGISTWTVTQDGKLAIDKLVTTRRLGAQGQPDVTFRDIQAPFQVMAGLRYIRAYLQTRHSQKALARKNPNNIAAISTPDDIKADTIAAHADTVARGIFEDNEGFAQRLVVEIDQTNANRVNLGMKLDRVNPLDILAGNATIYAQYQAA
ncbi:phage tail sheath subtilisin-like domain-containing protein [Microvirga solisilvae]|uniref:phage tail sheath subtilisin-like domain-containing protein n=1 Tax=Microvirga solisilvae TaxID=2919498 RepID=UPI001FAE8AF2|nr:phage tail sheath subtilisin-like domain-containing protein [Microvirga solisilvae]